MNLCKKCGGVPTIIGIRHEPPPVDVIYYICFCHKCVFGNLEVIPGQENAVEQWNKDNPSREILSDFIKTRPNPCKVCGTTGKVYRGDDGNWNCNCPKCHFPITDVVRLNPEQAVEEWNRDNPKKQ